MWVDLGRRLWFILLVIDEIMIKNNPASYWRKNQRWSALIGRKGEVIASTYIHSAGNNQELQTPYSFAIVKLDSNEHQSSEKIELMGTGHDYLQTGDRVECVLRKNVSPDTTGVIEYIIKAKKI